jgi:uncharacterized metal-binding protein
MNGKNHERILNFTFPFIAFYLGYIHSDLKAALIFWALWKVGTYLITCDLDTKSRSRKRLGILGWVIDKMFRHRGLLHSPTLWAVVGVFGYIGIGWPFLGIIIPQGVHIATDKL